MKKKIFMALTALFISTIAVMAQGTSSVNDQKTSGQAFSKGDVTIDIASGFGITYDYYGSFVSLPALTIGTDIGIIDHAGPGNISVGGIVGYKRAFNRDDVYDATWTNYLIAGRGTYHLTILNNNKFDPYGGVTAGIRINDYHDPYYDDRNNPNSYQSVYPVVGAFVGAKYYFFPGFGGFAEFGYDISILRIGISIKL